VKRTTSRSEFEQIVSEYTNYVFTLSYRILGNRQDAEDVVQETFLKLYNHFGEYDAQKSLRNWICTIAINTSRDYYRSKKHTTTELPIDETNIETVREKADNVEDQLFTQEMLKELNHDMRTALVLFYMERMSIKEIAQSIKRPEQLVKVRLYRARKILMEKFAGA
jgi:RNA polymerase sigma-70 factor (ECF subfamily)